jgi:hypothetical protein
MVTSLKSIPVNGTFTLMSGGGSFIKLSTTLVRSLETGEKLKVSASAAEGNVWNRIAEAEVAPAKAPKAAKAPRVVKTIGLTTAASEGAKVIGYLKTDAKKPFGARGTEEIVTRARSAWRLALEETATQAPEGWVPSRRADAVAA